MKKIILLTLTFILVLFSSCVNDISDIDYEKSNSRISNKARNVNGFDLKPFIDVTMKNIDAADITLNDFESLCSGQYSNRKGSNILINTQKHTVHFNIPNVTVNGKDYTNIYINYEYKIKSASKNLIYLSPLNISEIDTNIDKNDLKMINVCMSLYGFGEGRIECSNHLEGISYVPCGTYWKR